MKGDKARKRRADKLAKQKSRRADKLAKRKANKANKLARIQARQGGKTDRSGQRNDRKVDKKVEAVQARQEGKSARTAERQKVENVQARQAAMGDLWEATADVADSAAGAISDIYGGALLGGGDSGTTLLEDSAAIRPSGGKGPLIAVGVLALLGVGVVALRSAA